VEDRPIRQIIILAACLFGGGAFPANAQDQIDRMLDHGRVPTDLRQAHGYSDFTDPLGRFIDLLAAGDIAQARAIEPAACAAWVATRQTSALTGTFWAWNTEISLDTLCAHI